MPMSDVSAVSEVFLGAGIRSTWLDQFDGTVMEAWDRIEIPQILVAMSMHMGTPPVKAAINLRTAALAGIACRQGSTGAGRKTGVKLPLGQEVGNPVFT